MQRLLFPGDSQFWLETLRSLGHVAYGGADIGEVLAATAQIRDGDYESWHAAWLATAQRVAHEAGLSEAGGHCVSARDAYLRASNYYRTAEFFLHGTTPDPRHEGIYARSVECFRSAARLSAPPIEPVEIPYEGNRLPGYLYAADTSGGARATVVLHSGVDGTAEELHFFGAQAAQERGFTVLTFDGPGQPGPRHREGFVLRADWEHVVGPVLDYALARPEVDGEHVALLGLRLGGLLAPRAAAFERRLGALIALDGVYDCSEGVLAMPAISTDRGDAERRLRAAADPALDALFEELMTSVPAMRCGYGQSMYVMGLSTPRAAAARSLELTLRDGIAEQIRCPPSSARANMRSFSRASRRSCSSTSPAPRPLWSSRQLRAPTSTARPARSGSPSRVSMIGSRRRSAAEPLATACRKGGLQEAVTARSAMAHTGLIHKMVGAR